MRTLILLAITSTVLVDSDRPDEHAIVAAAEIVSDSGGAFRHLVIHFDPVAEQAVAPTYADLLRAVDSSVRWSVVVDQRAHFDRFRQLLRKWRVARPERFEAVVVGRAITTWSRDRYTLLGQGPRRLLLVGPRPERGHDARRNDWQAPFALARAVGPRLKVRVAPLVFDGGDLVATDKHLFVTSLLLKRNIGGELARLDRLRSWLQRTTGRAVMLIGDSPDDVPPHHVGMFLTPLGAKRVLVGDPALGRRLLPKETKLDGPIERDPSMLRRFDSVAHQLETAGFEVRRTPLVPLAGRLTYITYNNALLERRDGQLHAYVPQFGIEALDAAGRAAFEAASTRTESVIVHPIDVRGIYTHNGTVRCLVNVVARREGGSSIVLDRQRRDYAD